MPPKECAHINKCPLFPLFRVSHFLKVWRMNYCEGGFERCHRLQRAGAGEPVPLNLLPDGSLLRTSR